MKKSALILLCLVTVAMVGGCSKAEDPKAEAAKTGNAEGGSKTLPEDR